VSPMSGAGGQSAPRSHRIVGRAGCVLALGLALGCASSASAAVFTATPSNVSLPGGVGSGPNAITAGDLDGDGLPDLVTADGGTGSLSLLINGGGGSFAAAADLGVAPTPTGVAVGDLNGDGRPDIAVTQSTSNRLSLLFADPTGLNYSTETDISTDNFPSAVAIGDLDGDGLPDVVVTNSASNDAQLFEATSPGVYPTTPTATLTTGRNPSAVAIGDLNGDGRPDIVVANKTSGTLTVFLKNSGSGYTTQTLTVGVGTGPVSVAIGDLNGDGLPDLAVADSTNGTNGNRASLFIATAAGVYPSTPTTSLTTGTSPSSVVIGDFDGDGRADLAVANKLDNTVTVFLQDATGGTYTPSTVATDGGPVSLVASDLVGQGKLDLATANTFSGDVTLLANTTAQGSKTTLTASPTSSSFGQTVTFSAALAPLVSLRGAPTPTGTVTYTVDGVALAPTTVSGGTASLATQELGVGSHTITAAYSGDANYAPSTATTTYTVSAATTITGTHTGGLTITSGTTLITGAHITGSLSISAGASVDIEGSTIGGSLAAGHGGALRICGSTIGGSMSVSFAGGLVVAGDTGDAQCAVNTIGGALSLSFNTNGIVVVGNHVGGAVASTGNSGPGPFPGDPSTISGNG
jgi:hypothetical protein